MTIKAVIEEGKSGIFSIYAPDLKMHAINGQGNTVNEAKEDFINSFQEVVAIYTDENIPIPEELKTDGFDYIYDIASVFDNFKWINVTAFADKAGIKPSLLRQYRNKTTYVSEIQKKKIQSAMHSLADELKAISL
jgi:predicted RNase H-like HicB family nuclease